MRAATLAAIRRFFVAEDFLEVDTPALVAAPSPEANIEPFETRFSGRGETVPGYLIGSPELHMKRLLAEGEERLFQISRCFRNGEVTPVHNPEFSLLEWYRAGATYLEIAADCEALVLDVIERVCDGERLSRDGDTIDTRPPWTRMTVAEALREYAHVDLDPGASARQFAALARAAGCPSVGADDDWGDVFSKLLIERVEPALMREGKPVFLMDYPARLSALAKESAGDPRLAERVELYMGNMELANGFSEQNDARRQRRKLMAERERRRRSGTTLPLDEGFLDSLQSLPSSAGIALGIDRLVMLVAGTETIQEAMAFPFLEGTPP